MVVPNAWGISIREIHKRPDRHAIWAPRRVGVFQAKIKDITWFYPHIAGE